MIREPITLDTIEVKLFGVFDLDDNYGVDFPRIYYNITLDF